MPADAPRTFSLGPALAAALGLYAAIVAVVVARSLTIGDGTLIYYLDDAYIHFAMARSLAEFGVYGVTAHAFTASSTSPAWVALLALGFLVSASSSYVPLVLAAASSVLAIVLAVRIVAAHAGPRMTLAVGIGLVLLTPLPLLTIQGMEHALHAAGMLAACWWLALRATRTMETRATRTMENRPGLAAGLALFALLPLLRWESLWLVVLGAMLLAWRRRWLDVALIAGVAAFAVCAYGFWSMAHGWPFLPASVLTKTMLVAPLDYWNIRHVVGVLFYHPAVKFTFLGHGVGLAALMLVVAAAILWRLRSGRTLWQMQALFGVLFVVGGWLHAVGGSFGWGYRYEAYMFALGIVAVALNAPELADLWRAARGKSATLAGACVMLLVVAAAPVAWRSFLALQSIDRNLQLVLDRDYYPARLVAQNFPGEGVVGSNLGVLAWLHRGEIVDLFALGTREIVQFTMAGGKRSPQMIDRWAEAHNARIAIIFEADYIYLAGGPPHWIPVARITATPTIALDFGLYARDQEAALRLAQAVKATSIPRRSTVTVRLLPPYDRP